MAGTSLRPRKLINPKPQGIIPNKQPKELNELYNPLNIPLLCCLHNIYFSYSKTSGHKIFW